MNKWEVMTLKLLSTETKAREHLELLSIFSCLLNNPVEEEFKKGNTYIVAPENIKQLESYIDSTIL